MKKRFYSILNIKEKGVQKLMVTTKLTFLLLIMNVILVSAGNNNLTMQQIKVTGKITDAVTGELLIGVNVVVKGTTTGVISDVDGNYSLEIPNPDATLIFSYIGYIPDTIPVGNRSIIDVVLKQEVKKIDEVVVIGYGSVKKSDITGAVSVVNSDDINRVKAKDLSHALQGLTSGVEIMNSSGTPGQNPVIRIRGVGTVNAADPMVVVDGIRMSVGDLEFINTNDIENISVLKDASASAIYGLGAANGVIVVTTKKGKKGKIITTFNSYYGEQKATHFMDILSGPEWAGLFNEISDTNILDPAKVADVNWFNEISRIAPIQNYDFSFSGGSDLSTFSFSANYLDQQGILLRSFYKRFTARINSEHSLTGWLKVGENLNIARTSYENLKDNQDSYNRSIRWGLYSPITPPYDANGIYQRRIFPSPYSANPLEEINRGTTYNQKTSAIGSVYAEGTILKDFVIRSQMNLNYIIDEGGTYTPGYDNGVTVVPNSELYNRYSNYYTWLLENTLTYHKTIDVHDITLLAGYTASKYGQYNDMSIRNKQGPQDVPYFLRYYSARQYPDSAYVITGGSIQDNLFSTSVGILGRAMYSLMDRYIITASVRYDGSSKFYYHLYKPFPSLAFAWKISNEPWMKDYLGDNVLKFRVGWGKTGNDNIPSGIETEQVLSQMGYTFNDEWNEGRSVTSPANKEAKWETTTQKNIGCDASLLRNRLEINVDYFIRNTEGMLVSPAAPATNGIVSMPYINVGEVSNKGYEITINHRNKYGPFSYEIGGNISHIKNKVINLGDKFGVLVPNITYGQGFSSLTRTEAGYPMAYFYGYKTEGIFQSYKEIREHAYQNSQTEPGDLKFKDINGDGLINASDQTMIGTPHPKLIYGFHINLEYNGFDFQTMFNGIYDVDILMPYKTVTFKPITDGSNFSGELLNSWTPDNTNTDIPRLTTSDPNQNLRYSDFLIENGSYLRLKMIQLGYTIPGKLLSRINIQKLRIYISGQNLLTFTKYTGNDPEIGFSRGTINTTSTERKTLFMNIDFINVPQPKTWLIGLNLTF